MKNIIMCITVLIMITAFILVIRFTHIDSDIILTDLPSDDFVKSVDLTVGRLNFGDITPRPRDPDIASLDTIGTKDTVFISRPYLELLQLIHLDISKLYLPGMEIPDTLRDNSYTWTIGFNRDGTICTKYLNLLSFTYSQEISTLGTDKKRGFIEVDIQYGTMPLDHMKRQTVIEPNSRIGSVELATQGSFEPQKVFLASFMLGDVGYHIRAMDISQEYFIKLLLTVLGYDLDHPETPVYQKVASPEVYYAELVEEAIRNHGDGRL